MEQFYEVTYTKKPEELIGLTNRKLSSKHLLETTTLFLDDETENLAMVLRRKIEREYGGTYIIHRLLE